jgi:hypothetical protein
MVDAVSFSKINPNYNMGTAIPAVTAQEFNDEKSVNEEELFMCVPSLYGFSFTTKKWRQLYIDDLNGIVENT